MNRVQRNGLHLWEFQNLAEEPGVRHFVTGRNTQQRLNGEFTLSLSSTPDKEHVIRNRKLLAEAMQVPDTRLFFPSQVHGTRIVHVTPRTQKEELLEADALVTAEPDLCIAVMSADCVPILLYDRKNRVVAAVHSGWRGTVAHILQKTLHTLRDQFGSQGHDIIAGIGPSVSQASYQVGEEVVREVRGAFGKAEQLLIAEADNKARLDLWKANEFQLLDFGVPLKQIEVSDLCTVKNNDHFFSARKGDAGRFAAGIMLV
jgi:YfiH family protein